mgnify:CR=1 FL=1
MQPHVSLNSFFPYNPVTGGALEEGILPTLSENHASDLSFDVLILCFDVLIPIEMEGTFSLSNDGCVGQQLRQMNLATQTELLEFAKSFLNAST